MPHLPFDFTQHADPQGVVHVERQIGFSFLKIGINSFVVRTASGCQERPHRLQVHVNQDLIYDGRLHDCSDLLLETQRAWRAPLIVSFRADGYDPHELVQGHGTVDFVPRLL